MPSRNPSAPRSPHPRTFCSCPSSRTSSARSTANTRSSWCLTLPTASQSSPSLRISSFPSQFLPTASSSPTSSVSGCPLSRSTPSRTTPSILSIPPSPNAPVSVRSSPSTLSPHQWPACLLSAPQIPAAPPTLLCYPSYHLLKPLLPTPVLLSHPSLVPSSMHSPSILHQLPIPIFKQLRMLLLQVLLKPDVPPPPPPPPLLLLLLFFLFFHPPPPPLLLTVARKTTR